MKLDGAHPDPSSKQAKLPPRSRAASKAFAVRLKIEAVASFCRYPVSPILTVTLKRVPLFRRPRNSETIRRSLSEGIIARETLVEGIRTAN